MTFGLLIMAFGLLIMAFEDAVKEGDEQRLFETYKLLLLIDKSHHHPKYAHETLHYLIKVCAIQIGRASCRERV